jgi:hypothetical protein
MNTSESDSKKAKQIYSLYEARVTCCALLLTAFSLCVRARVLGVAVELRFHRLRSLPHLTADYCMRTYAEMLVC